MISLAPFGVPLGTASEFAASGSVPSAVICKQQGRAVEFSRELHTWNSPVDASNSSGCLKLNICDDLVSSFMLVMRLQPLDASRHSTGIGEFPGSRGSRRVGVF